MLTVAGTPADRVTGLSLELGPLHRTVTRDGQQIHLSPRNSPGGTRCRSALALPLRSPYPCAARSPGSVGW
jgi:hypothetical protein